MDNVPPNSDYSSNSVDFGHGVAMGGDGTEIAWIVLAAAALIAAIVLVVWIVKRVLPVARNPLTVLDMRLASGEIDEQTYARTRAALMAGQPGAVAQAPAAQASVAQPPVATPAPAGFPQQAGSAPTAVLPTYEAGAQAPTESATQESQNQ
ncbi:hypothetical protein [Actinomyces culturomici]|uniref:hypothetical protein n=1 Tax=Actinomyces culturomici TaxID=1926276 RepID=UPI000E20AD06|nr:hypothetical protein [Actinomyces culturomici]